MQIHVYHVYLLVYTWYIHREKVIHLYKGFGLHLQIRASPKSKFKLRGVHLNPHAWCRSSNFNLKLFKKIKTGVT